MLKQDLNETYGKIVHLMQNLLIVQSSAFG